jgi:Pyridoxamine 5'-phosphate oxidase
MSEERVRTSRPQMPEGYGVDTATIYEDWPTVEERLREATEYWLATTRADGRPHVIPRWGIWLDGRLWYDGSPQTLHARNLALNPACALHLESGSTVTIVEGSSLASSPVAGELGERVSAEYRRKYEARGYAPGPDSWSDEIAGGMRILTPVKALAWSKFPDDLTRFDFEAPTT